MNLHGKNFIGGNLSAENTAGFHATNARTGEKLSPPFHEAINAEIHAAFLSANQAFSEVKNFPPEKIASFLHQIAEEILRLGDELIQRAQAETALPEPRLLGERARTISQIKMFADLVTEGSWINASIDLALPERKPLPKPDLRKMLVPIGPVVVFGASNFPFAFSVAGGDTISALAAKNPVIVKAHPGHPGVSEMVARAIQSAGKATQMPAGLFSLLHGTSHDVGLQLVRHAATKAVGFTGSLKAGRALFNAAAARPEPIPVFVEMGSTNPIFILPNALQKNGNALAENLIQSVTLGVGQFCTNPGLVFGLRDEHWRSFAAKTAQLAEKISPGTMLYPNLCKSFHDGFEQIKKISSVTILGKSSADSNSLQAPAVVFSTDAKTFLQNEILREELFGPATLLVECDSLVELENLAQNLPGQLTATIHGTEEELSRAQNLISILQEKAGRLLFNQFPTGVEVCSSMHHGGPYPATTDSRSTSVGTAAIERFAKPICFQNFPDAALPVELQNKN
ncbi:MAG: aldehyde dehydrogenase (NADP(+)), partial [Limisphaerales bacterium]